MQSSPQQHGADCDESTVDPEKAKCEPYAPKTECLQMALVEGRTFITGLQRQCRPGKRHGKEVKLGIARGDRQGDMQDEGCKEEPLRFFDRMVFRPLRPVMR